MGVDHSQGEMLLFPGFPADQQQTRVLPQQRQPGERQHVGGSSPCQLGHGGAGGGQRRKEMRKQSLGCQGSH